MPPRYMNENAIKIADLQLLATRGGRRQREKAQIEPEALGVQVRASGGRASSSVSEISPGENDKFDSNTAYSLVKNGPGVPKLVQKCKPRPMMQMKISKGS